MTDDVAREIGQEIASLEGERDLLNIQIAALANLLRKRAQRTAPPPSKPSPPPPSAPSPQAHDASSNGALKGKQPTSAILEYVEAHPGSSRKEIIRALATTPLASKAKSKPRLLDALIWQLEDRGRLIKKGNGFWLSEED